MSDYASDAVRQLDYCTYCPRLCHFSCPTSLGDGSETATAWGMMTLANIERKGEIALDADLARTFYNCASCRRCQEFCKHRSDVGAVLQTARERVVKAGHVPAELAELPTNYQAYGAPSAPEPELDAMLQASAPPARIGLFLSCAHRESFDRGRVAKLLAVLSHIAAEPVVLAWSSTVSCCGGVASRAGMATVARDAEYRLRSRLSGFAIVLTDCSDVEDLLESDNGAQGQPHIIPLMSFLASQGDSLRELASGRVEEVTLHGGCRERRYWSLGDEETTVLEAIGMRPTDAFAYNGHQECCGGDAVFRAVRPDAADRAAERLVDRASDSDEERRLVTSACRCSRHMSTKDSAVPSILDLVVDRCSIPS